jgi:hypothetical protein
MAWRGTCGALTCVASEDEGVDCPCRKAVWSVGDCGQTHQVGQQAGKCLHYREPGVNVSALLGSQVG